MRLINVYQKEKLTLIPKKTGNAPSISITSLYLKNLPLKTILYLIFKLSQIVNPVNVKVDVT